mmetsp:Transcript_27710/g.69890  ORF Transcript_27710/g.69890 Transcript_27710/m.69890 type:complete len:230 (-) Transcript_27710:1299-1988(-)
MKFYKLRLRGCMKCHESENSGDSAAYIELQSAAAAPPPAAKGPTSSSSKGPTTSSCSFSPRSTVLGDARILHSGSGCGHVGEAYALRKAWSHVSLEFSIELSSLPVCEWEKKENTSPPPITSDSWRFPPKKKNAAVVFIASRVCTCSMLSATTPPPPSSPAPLPLSSPPPNSPPGRITKPRQFKSAEHVSCPNRSSIVVAASTSPTKSMHRALLSQVSTGSLFRVGSWR